MGIQYMSISSGNGRRVDMHIGNENPFLRNWPPRPPNTPEYEDPYQHAPWNNWALPGDADFDPHILINNVDPHIPDHDFDPHIFTPELDDIKFVIPFAVSPRTDNVFVKGNKEATHKVRNEDVSPRHTLVASILIAVVAAVFCFVILLTMFLYARRHRRQNSRSIQSDVTAEQSLSIIPPGNSQDQNNGYVRVLLNTSPQTDSPPPYAKCTNQDSNIHKILKAATEELPPPYSSCVGTSTNITKERDEAGTHTRDCVREVDRTEEITIHGDSKELSGLNVRALDTEINRNVNNALLSKKNITVGKM